MYGSIVGRRYRRGADLRHGQRRRRLLFVVVARSLLAGTRILARFLSPQEVIIGDIFYISIVQTIAKVNFNENLPGKHLEDLDDSTLFYFHVVLIWRERYHHI